MVIKKAQIEAYAKFQTNDFLERLHAGIARSVIGWQATLSDFLTFAQPIVDLAASYGLTQERPVADYIIFSLSYPELRQKPLPLSCHEALSWEGREQSDKIEHLKAALELL